MVLPWCKNKPPSPYAALLGLIAPAFAQEQFGTPEAAVEALVTAARSEDGAAILTVLGPDGKPIVSSGDPVADSNTGRIL